MSYKTVCKCKCTEKKQKKQTIKKQKTKKEIIKKVRKSKLVPSPETLACGKETENGVQFCKKCIKCLIRSPATKLKKIDHTRCPQSCCFITIDENISSIFDKDIQMFDFSEYQPDFLADNMPFDYLNIFKDEDIPCAQIPMPLDFTELEDIIRHTNEPLMNLNDFELDLDLPVVPNNSFSDIDACDFYDLNFVNTILNEEDIFKRLESICFSC